LTTIYHGVDPAFFAAGAGTVPPAAVAGRRFIFALGSEKPYKNIPRLLQAFALIAPHYSDLALAIRGQEEACPTCRRLVGDLGLTSRVVFVPRLSDAEVRACFVRAVFFVFPSLVEGFGLPVIEAMAGGCPVLAADIPPLREVAGDAALLVDPGQVQAIAAGMRRLLDQPPLRQELTNQGRARAARFDWRMTAAQTLEVYRQVMAGRPENRRPALGVDRPGVDPED
jgi:glycosyltransferase involved in cell wall biosynthesis